MIYRNAGNWKNMNMYYIFAWTFFRRFFVFWDHDFSREINTLADKEGFFGLLIKTMKRLISISFGENAESINPIHFKTLFLVKNEEYCVFS